MGVATHKVLMCQPYDIYCLGGEEKRHFSTLRLLLVLLQRRLLLPPAAGGVNLPRVGNKWQTKAGGVMGDVGVAMGE